MAYHGSTDGIPLPQALENEFGHIWRGEYEGWTLHGATAEIGRWPAGADGAESSVTLYAEPPASWLIAKIIRGSTGFMGGYDRMPGLDRIQVKALTPLNMTNLLTSEPRMQIAESSDVGKAYMRAHWAMQAWAGPRRKVIYGVKIGRNDIAEDERLSSTVANRALMRTGQVCDRFDSDVTDPGPVASVAVEATSLDANLLANYRDALRRAIDEAPSMVDFSARIGLNLDPTEWAEMEERLQRAYLTANPSRLPDGDVDLRAFQVTPIATVGTSSLTTQKIYDPTLSQGLVRLGTGESMPARVLPVPVYRLATRLFGKYAVRDSTGVAIEVLDKVRRSVPLSVWVTDELKVQHAEPRFLPKHLSKCMKRLWLCHNPMMDGMVPTDVEVLRHAVELPAERWPKGMAPPKVVIDVARAVLEGPERPKRGMASRDFHVMEWAQGFSDLDEVKHPRFWEGRGRPTPESAWHSAVNDWLARRGMDFTFGKEDVVSVGTSTGDENPHLRGSAAAITPQTITVDSLVL